MNTYLILSIVGTVVAVVMVAVILMGRGDWLISGYNTASEEKKARYILPRLRLLTAVAIVVLVLFMWLTYILNMNEVIESSVILVIALIVVVLQYTWARR